MRERILFSLLCFLLISSAEGGRKTISRCDFSSNTSFFATQKRKNTQVKVYKPYYLTIENSSPQKQKKSYWFYPLIKEVQTPTTIKKGVLGGIISSYTQTDPSYIRKEQILPFYCRRITEDSQTSYLAIFPFCGKVQNVLIYDEINFAMFPIIAQVRRNSETSNWFLWPIFRWQSGEKSSGGAIWPIWGNLKRDQHYRYRYAFWPLLYEKKEYNQIGEETLKRGFLPFFASERSKDVNDLTLLWPLLGQRQEPNYHEWRWAWPFMVQARGHTYINRWAPFYSHSIQKKVDKRWVAWPFIKWTQWNEKGLDLQRQQFLYFLFWQEIQKNKNTQQLVVRKTHLWPWFSDWKNTEPYQRQFYMLSPLEVFFPKNLVVQKNYSPLFCLYKLNATETLCEESFLWNLISSQKTAETKSVKAGPFLQYHKNKEKTSFEILGGFLGAYSDHKKKSFKFLWIQFNRKAR